MGRAIDRFLADWLPWLSDIAPERREFLYWSIPIAAGLIWACFKWVVPALRKLNNWWWTKRQLQKPREHELGFHDHRARLKKLWRRLSYLRSDVYRHGAAVSKLTKGVKEKKESAPAEFWAARATALRPKVTKLEAVSREMGDVTALMLSSFKVVCGRSTQASMDALKLFTENDPSTLQWQMKEDTAAFILMKICFTDLKGEKFEMNRVCDRGVAAMDAIIQGNIAIFGACEAVIDGAKLPKPKLEPIWVRATQPGFYANGRRRVGDVFPIQSDRDFSPKWMEKVDKPVK